MRRAVSLVARRAFPENCHPDLPRFLGTPGGRGALLSSLPPPLPAPPHPPQSSRESHPCLRLLQVPAGLWSLESAAWQLPQQLASVMETAAAAGDGHV